MKGRDSFHRHRKHIHIDPEHMVRNIGLRLELGDLAVTIYSASIDGELH